MYEIKATSLLDICHHAKTWVDGFVVVKTTFKYYKYVFHYIDAQTAKMSKLLAYTYSSSLMLVSVVLHVLKSLLAEALGALECKHWIEPRHKAQSSSLCLIEVKCIVLKMMYDNKKSIKYAKKDIKR